MRFKVTALTVTGFKNLKIKDRVTTLPDIIPFTLRLLLLGKK